MMSPFHNSTHAADVVQATPCSPERSCFRGKALATILLPNAVRERIPETYSEPCQLFQDHVFCENS